MDHMASQVDLSEDIVGSISPSTSDASPAEPPRAATGAAVAADSQSARETVVSEESGTPAAPNPLMHRPILPTDVPILKRMRRICGWGESRVATYLEPRSGYDIYLFSAEVSEEDGDLEEVIGMGGIRFDSEDDTIANKAEGLVQITSLFIYPQFQSLGLGRHMMHILENICFHKYQAKQICVMTTAYEDVYAKEKDGEYGKVAKWYMRLGYQSWREPQLLPFPGDETGERTHYAVYLKKQVR